MTYQNYNNNYFPNQSRFFSGLKGHPVASFDEVKATSVDFDGSISYFPDLANNKIYTKQVNFDGTVSMNMYELKPIEPQLTTDYITRKEFEETLAKILTVKPQVVKKEEKKVPAVTDF